MENKINIAEILKSCPQGMELDCLLCNNPIELEGVVDDDAGYPIKAVGKDGFLHVFTSYGASYYHDDAKCVIFPKGKTTWEGFVPPIEFKDGDILCNSKTKQPFILKFFDLLNNNIHSYCGIDGSNKFYTSSNNWAYASDIRLATEEEKQKLFDAIKDNGYKWNEETKKLEKVSQYPLTFEECCTVLGLTELGIIGGYRRGLLTQFRNLLICRDAYWKIAGNWKPDIMYGDLYCIGYDGNVITWKMQGGCRLLVFPTEEMRDAFYENFEEIMNECKSLL